jgi:hypothetical protein
MLSKILATGAALSANTMALTMRSMAEMQLLRDSVALEFAQVSSQTDDDLDEPLVDEVTDQEEEDLRATNDDSLFGEVGYFNSTTYLNMDYEQKMDQLWEMIVADDTPKEQTFEDLDLLWVQNLFHSLYFFSDELLRSSKKVIHQQGIVGKARWHNQGGHSYTGLFSEIDPVAIMRFSESEFLVPEASGLAPSFAMKFPISDTWSVNVLTRTSFEPSTSWNFWDADFKHRHDQGF